MKVDVLMFLQGRKCRYGTLAKKGNKHFDDQVELYIQQPTKRMTLKKEEVYKMAERVFGRGNEIIYLCLLIGQATNNGTRDWFTSEFDSLDL